MLLATLGHSTESAVPSPREYRLRFYHTHTGERLDVVYRRGDHYIAEALDELDHYLRDHRTGDVRHFDPRLFALLYLTLPNYTNNFLRLGFSSDNCKNGGSDRLVDAIVAWDDLEAIRNHA